MIVSPKYKAACQLCVNTGLALWNRVGVCWGQMEGSLVNCLLCKDSHGLVWEMDNRQDQICAEIDSG